MTRPLSTLESIWCAVIASEHLSFHRAAATMGVRQSSVSRRVRALEDALGVSLFERHRSGLRLTEAGRVFIHQARSILSDLDYAVITARNAGRGATGSLRIGFCSSLASGFLRDLLVEFKRAHSDVAIDLRRGSASAHIRDVRDRNLDVAFFTGRPNLQGCDVELLWHERMFCVLPLGHSLTTAEAISWDMLRDEPFIVSRDEPGPGIHEYLIQRLATLGFHPDVKRFRVCRESLLHMVAMGFGLTLTSEAMVCTPLPGLTYRPIAGTDDILPFVAVWSPANDNPALRRLISLGRALRQGEAAHSSGPR